MLIDTCLYNGERDLLELRFEVLKPKVDLFIVVEGTLTFTGRPREVKHDWCMKYPHVTHIVVSNFPEASERNPWKREMYQRNQILSPLSTYSYAPETVIMVSDVDELPDPADLPDTLEPGTLIRFQHDTYHFNFNNHVVNDNAAKQGWSGTCVCRLDDLRRWFPQGVRNMTEGVTIRHSGWHLSWMVDPETKLKSYSHHELNKLTGSIPERVQRRWDYQYEHVAGMEHLPQVIQSNPEKWSKYFNGLSSPITI